MDYEKYTANWRSSLGLYDPADVFVDGRWRLLTVVNRGHGTIPCTQQDYLDFLQFEGANKTYDRYD